MDRSARNPFQAPNYSLRVNFPKKSFFFQVCAVMRVNLKRVLQVGGKMIFWREGEMIALNAPNFMLYVLKA